MLVDRRFGSVYEDIFGLTMDSQVKEAGAVEVVKHNYPQLKHPVIGKVFNRRSVLLHIKWGKVQGKPTLRSTVSRVTSRDEEDEVLLQFDMTVEPINADDIARAKVKAFDPYDDAFQGCDAVDIPTPIYKHPKQYVFQALKEAKRQFSDKVGCVVCGKPNIWFKKIQTPQFPLYRVMFKEIDFADSDNRVCSECDKLVNRRQAEFNPVPELDDDGKQFNSIFADSVSEPFTIRKDLQLDSPDFLAALDVHATNLQLGG